MNTDEIFHQLSALPRFVPYKLIYDPKREKFDKIPHNGRHGLSTADPTAWKPLIEALDTAKENGLSGVGFVMTGGIEVNGLTLVGFDFDDVTSDFIPPFKSYAERSPSKKGVRMFAWVKTVWAKRFQDTLDCHPAHCDHCEVYLGTAARFLTLTFDVIQAEEIAQLTGRDLLTIESWGLHDFETTSPSVDAPELEVGTPFDWARLGLTPDQKHLVNGTGDIDRSAILMGLIIKAADAGRAKEDVLASMVRTPAIWRELTDHRNDPDKALQFAKDEVNRLWAKSLTGKKEALFDFNEKWKTTMTTPETSPTFPLEVFDKAPGLVGEIARWIMGASYSPREEFAYAVALSITACLIGPYCTIGLKNIGLNLYIVLVGETGTGKNEAADSGLEGLLSQTEAKDSVLDFPASEAALRRQLGVSPNVLIRADELAHKIESLKGDINGSSMSKAILEMFNNARLPPKIYADEKKTLPAVENPFVQILGCTTGKIWEALQTQHLRDGTLNRIIFVCLGDDAPYIRNPNASYAMEKAFKDKLNTFWRAGRMRDLLGDVPGFGRKVEFTPEVAVALEALGPELFKKQAKEYGELYTRVELYVSKIASILAVGDGRLVVSMQDFQAALAFMNWSVGTTLHKVSGTLAGSAFESKIKRVIRLLQKAGGKLSLRDLYRKMSLSRREMEELLGTLGLSERVVETTDENGMEWVELLD